MVDVSIFEFPLSGLLAVVWMLAIVLVLGFFPENRYVKFLSGWKFSVCMLSVVGVLTGIEGTWKLNIQHNIVFLFLCLVLMTSLAAVCYKSIRARKSPAYILSHLGFLVLMCGVFWGAADFQEAVMPVCVGEENYLANDKQGRVCPLPFKVKLEEFKTEYYDDGVSPKQYSSEFSVEGKHLRTAVNSPCRHKGWMIYQYSFDKDRPDVSVLGFVRDPLLPVIYLGMLLLALGTVLSIGSVWKNKYMLPAILVLAVVFTFISLAKINFGTLVPALRSLWFVPHLIIYMIAYSLLAIASILGVISLARKSDNSCGGTSVRLLETASSLLLLGMLCGAVWAKSAWGDYWTWDAKECWAATTWLITLVPLHVPGIFSTNCSKGKRAVAVLLILLSFLAMQVTWYGVNKLPAARYSMHSYK